MLERALAVVSSGQLGVAQIQLASRVFPQPYRVQSRQGRWRPGQQNRQRVVGEQFPTGPRQRERQRRLPVVLGGEESDRLITEYHRAGVKSEVAGGMERSGENPGWSRRSRRS